MDEHFADIDFPDKGLDLSMGFEAQRDGTCSEGLNVADYEPSTGRARGGSRAGINRVINERLPLTVLRTDIDFPRLIQHLNIVVYGATSALLDGPDPGGDSIDDPSSAGPPGSWGSGPLDYDWDGNPVRGSDAEDRNPKAGARKKRRKKGSGIQPNKNVIGQAPAGPTYLYQCSGQIHINAPGHAIDGTDATFAGCACVGAIYLALAGEPTHATQFSKWHVNRIAYLVGQGVPPSGTWTFNEGSNLITGPVRICTAADVAGGCVNIFNGNPGTYPGG